MTEFLSLVIVKKEVSINNLHRLIKILNKNFDTFYTILYYKERYYHKVRISDIEKSKLFEIVSHLDILKDSEIYIDQYTYEERKYGVYKDFVESHFIYTTKWITNSFFSKNNFNLLESLIMEKVKKLPIEDREDFLDYSFNYWRNYAEMINFNIDEETIYEIELCYNNKNSDNKLDFQIKNNLEKLYNLSSNRITKLKIPYFDKSNWDDYKKIIFSLNHMDANKLGIFPNKEAVFYYYLKEAYFGE